MRFISACVVFFSLWLVVPSAAAQDEDPNSLIVDDAPRISGGELVTQATEIDMGVVYADAIADGQARWYAVSVQEGQRVEVTLAEDGSLDYGCCVELRLYAPDQESDFGREGGYSDGEPKIYRTETAEGGAPVSGTYFVSVELDDFGPLDGDLAYQVKVAEAGATVNTDAGDDKGIDADGDPDQADGDEPVTADDVEEAVDEAASDGSVQMLLTLLIVMGLIVIALGGAVIFLLVRLGRQ